MSKKKDSSHHSLIRELDKKWKHTYEDPESEETLPTNIVIPGYDKVELIGDKEEDE